MVCTTPSWSFHRYWDGELWNMRTNGNASAPPCTEWRPSNIARRNHIICTTLLNCFASPPGRLSVATVTSLNGRMMMQDCNHLIEHTIQQVSSGEWTGRDHGHVVAAMLVQLGLDAWEETDKLRRTRNDPNDGQHTREPVQHCNPSCTTTSTT